MQQVDRVLAGQGVRLDVAGRFTLFICLGLAVLFTLSAVLILWQQRSAMEGLLNDSRTVVSDMFTQGVKEREARELEGLARDAKLMSQIVPEAVAGMELSTLADYVKVVAGDPAIAYASITNSTGQELAASGSKAGLTGEMLVTQSIDYEGTQLGTVTFGYNRAPLDAYVATAEKANTERLVTIESAMKASVSKSLLSMTVMMIVIASAVALLTHFLFHAMVARRLASLEARFRDIAEGEADLTKRIEVHGNDSLDRLGRYFNQVMDKIHGAITQVADTVGDLTSESDRAGRIVVRGPVGIDPSGPLPRNQTAPAASWCRPIGPSISSVSGSPCWPRQ